VRQGVVQRHEAGEAPVDVAVTVELDAPVVEAGKRRRRPKDLIDVQALSGGVDDSRLPRVRIGEHDVEICGSGPHRRLVEAVVVLERGVDHVVDVDHLPDPPRRHEATAAQALGVDRDALACLSREEVGTVDRSRAAADDKRERVSQAALLHLREGRQRIDAAHAPALDDERRSARVGGVLGVGLQDVRQGARGCRLRDRLREIRDAHVNTGPGRPMRPRI
jgi:hypothetical protein